MSNNDSSTRLLRSGKSFSSSSPHMLIPCHHPPISLILLIFVRPSLILSTTIISRYSSRKRKLPISHFTRTTYSFCDFHSPPRYVFPLPNYTTTTTTDFSCCVIIQFSISIDWKTPSTSRTHYSLCYCLKRCTRRFQ